MRAQWQQLGVDPDQARAASQESGPAGQEDQEDDGDIELEPEQWDAWRCYLATWNQWRVVSNLMASCYQGIDQASLLAVMQMLGIKPKHRPRVFWDVQTLEDEGRKLRNQKH
ncbi:hypothetical protein GY14_02565 [Delftia tsuruhatensis]|nr:hypothetical protein GY14_02565 [Delftia tsuruhatensis]